jgi:hypothetical protein
MGDSMYLMWGGVGYGLFYVFDVRCGEGVGSWMILFIFNFIFSTVLYMLSQIICLYVVIILLPYADINLLLLNCRLKPFIYIE